MIFQLLMNYDHSVAVAALASSLCTTSQLGGKFTPKAADRKQVVHGEMAMWRVNEN